MTEYSPAIIYIGGKLRDDQLDELASAAEDDGAGLDWGEDSPSSDEIRVRLQPGSQLYLMNDEAPHGELYTLENFCSQHNLSYRRRSEAYAEYDSEITGWEPGMDTIRHCLANQNGQPVITISNLRRYLQANTELHQVITELTWFEPWELPPFEAV